MDGQRPLISVVMPFRHAAAFVAEAVRSIQGQTYPRWELIAVDDGSTDGSARTVRALAAADERIRYLRIEPRGVGGALNAGVAVAGGALIARMDADDLALPERFAVQEAWMRETGTDVCGSLAHSFGDDDRLLWFPQRHDDVVRELLFGNSLLHPTVMARAEVFRANPYAEIAQQDYELWTRLVHRYRVGNVPAVLLRHRLHPHQTRAVHAQAGRLTHRRARRDLLRTLFPAAREVDVGVFDRLAEKQPFANLPDLVRAGEWLARLAGDSEDRELRAVMLRRFSGCCRRSAHLGPAVHRAHRRLAPRFGVAVDHDGLGLQVACRLRVAHGSPAERRLRRVRRTFRGALRATA